MINTTTLAVERGSSTYLNELPMADLLDSYMEPKNGQIVLGYTFEAKPIKYASVSTKSDVPEYGLQIYPVDEHFKDIINSDYYLPYEVNGQDGLSSNKEVLDAHRALYEYERRTEKEEDVDDVNGIIQSADWHDMLVPKAESVPLLIAESFRHMLSVDTDLYNDVLLKMDKAIKDD